MGQVEGVLSHQLKQFIIDGNKCVLNRPGPEAKVEDGEFEEYEVYGIDVLVRCPVSHALLLNFSQCPYVQVTQGGLGFQTVFIDAVHLG